MLSPTQAPARYAPPEVRARRAAQAAPPSRAKRVRRVLTVAALICLVPALISYGQALTKSSNSTFFIRTVEWLRDNGARGLVNRVENTYYSLTAPAKGGPGLTALPRQAGAAASAGLPKPAAVHYYRPPAIPPVIHPALPGEGVWHATFEHGGSRPPVLITSFRPSSDYPQVVAGVAWIDHTRTTMHLYPGAREPAVSLPDRGPEEVPTAKRSQLVATFNSGFKLADSRGGFAYHGHTYEPMQSGMATLVGYTSGKVDLIPWTGGEAAGSDVVFARQNLPLIVNHGRPNPNLSDGPEWGSTLGNKILVWRSAVGIDTHGNLIYAAANDQTVGSLAQIMVRAGAVRAMELDINAEWTSFITYRVPGAGDPANLVATMERPADRYLSPDDRDFFVAYLK